MKYLSLFLVVAFLQLTWWFSQQKSDLSVSQRNKVTSLIREYMTQAVKKNDPTITDIKFSTMSTEIIERGRKMRAHFRFSYLQPVVGEEPSRVYRKGSFFIASSDGDQWQAQVEQVNDVQVEFMKPQAIEVDSSLNEQPTHSETSDSSISNENSQ